MKIKKRFIGLVTGLVVFFFWLFSEGFKSVLSEIFIFLHPKMYKLISWFEFFAPQKQENPLLAFGTFFFSLSLIVCSITGSVVLIKFLIAIFKKKETGIKTNKNPCEEELSSVINAFDENAGAKVFNDKTISFMKAIEYEVTRIFDLKKGELQCLWVVPGNTVGSYKITFLEDEVIELPTAEILIESSLKQGDSRIVVEKVSGYINNSDKIKQFTIVKNYGKFRLGLCVNVLKENIFNSENMKEFEELSSYFLLLGFNNKFAKEIDKKAKVTQAS